MRKRKLGSTGLLVSEIGFGCGTVGGLMTRGSAAEQQRAIGLALDHGITYFDTAPQYGDGVSEESLGRALAALRPDVVVATKVKVPAVEPREIGAAIRMSLEASLRRLRRDSVDLLQVHNTIADVRQPGGLTAAEVIDHAVPALDGLVRDGKIRNFGMTALGDTAALHRLVDFGRFATAQVALNLLNPTAVRSVPARYPAQDYGRLLERMAEHGMGGVCIRVMAAGALSGGPLHPLARAGAKPMGSGSTFERDAERAAAFHPLIESGYAASLPAAAIRYALSFDGMSIVLIGVSGSEQIVDATSAAAAGPLPPDALHLIERIQTDFVGQAR